MEGSGTALERRMTPLAIALITDDEIRRLYRVAESLALSKMFKDVGRAEQAFAKMIIGRDLGMSPAQAMLGLHIVEGSVMVHYSMLGRFIKARDDEGYDYRSGWIKLEPAAAPDEPPQRVQAWGDEDDPTDTREIVGAFVHFWAGGKLVGISTFTTEDAQKAGLIKDNAKAAWNTSRRNMLLARAMSNGVKWFVPEVMGGLPIYVEGEVVSYDVTDPVGEGGDEGTGVDLGPKVEAIITRAQELGHAGLSNRGALEIALGNRAPAVVNQWLVDAKAELDRFEAAESPADEENAEREIPEAEVVEPEPESKMPAETIAAAAAADEMGVTILRNRLTWLEEQRGEEQDPEKRAQIDEEMEFVRGQLGEA